MQYSNPAPLMAWFYTQNVVTVCGNLVILLAIYRDRRLRSNNDVLVANLGEWRWNFTLPHPVKYRESKVSAAAEHYTVGSLKNSVVHARPLSLRQVSSITKYVTYAPHPFFPSLMFGAQRWRIHSWELRTFPSCLRRVAMPET